MVCITVLPIIVIPEPVVAVNPGSDALLECIVTGKPAPVVAWYSGSIQLPDSSFPRYSVSENDSLIISDAQFDVDDGAQFICRATNEAGTESATIEVNVNGEYKLGGFMFNSPHSTVAPTATAKNSSVSVVEEGNILLSCVVTGDPTPNILWYSGDILITEDTPSTAGYTDNCMLIILLCFKDSSIQLIGKTLL